MDKIAAVRLQQRLGVTADGVMGRGTYAALFVRCGAGTRASALAMGAAVHLPAHGVSDTPLRLAHFLAQVGHESGGFRHMEELGGSVYFARYDGRADLGNTEPGDGARYHGRGPIQLTGRANYRRFGAMLGFDLEAHPEIAAMPAIGVLIAAAYWSDRKLNALADADDVRAITRRINGGLNGFDDRCKRLARMKELML